MPIDTGAQIQAQPTVRQCHHGGDDIRSELLGGLDSGRICCLARTARLLHLDEADVQDGRLVVRGWGQFEHL